MLRTALREVLAALSVRAVRSKLPGEFVDELYRAFPISEADRILRGFARRRYVTLRANTLKATVDEVLSELKRAGVKCQRVPWYSDALVIQNKREQYIESLELYVQGKVYLQSLSSMIPPLVLALNRGDRPGYCSSTRQQDNSDGCSNADRGRIVAAEIDRMRR